MLAGVNVKISFMEEIALKYMQHFHSTSIEGEEHSIWRNQKGEAKFREDYWSFLCGRQ
jgi:hypothetical protein